MTVSVRLDGRALRRLRRTRGHRSAASLAPHINLSPHQLYDLESGRAAASPDLYERLRTYFGLEPGDLLAAPGACPRCGSVPAQPAAPRAA